LKKKWITHDSIIQSLTVADKLGLEPLVANASMLGMLAFERLVQIGNDTKREKATTLLCLGPLTNVSLGIDKDCNMLKNFKRIVIMGGCVYERGNAPNSVAEWNFYSDPVAAKNVIGNITGVPVFVIGLEVANEKVLSRDQQIELTMLKEQVTTKKFSVGRLAKLLIQHFPFAVSWDPVASSYLVRPGIHSFSEMMVEVRTDSASKEEGRLIKVNEKGVETGLINLALEFDKKEYADVLRKVIVGS